MITDDQGRVAVRFLSPNAARAMNEKYFFEPRAGVSIAWVWPEDWQILKTKIIGCCGKTDPLFYPAEQAEVDRWLEGLA